MEETDKAYIAGIIDGEGSIWMNKQVRGYGLILTVNMTSKKTVNHLAKLWNTKLHTRGIPKGGRKPIWTVRLSGSQTKELLLQVLPYLIDKRLRAELALEFPIYIQHAGKQRNDDDDFIRDTIYHRISYLNKYGEL